MKPVEFRHGAQLEDEATTRFSLWAPSAKKVSVVLEGGRTLEMRAYPAGWYSTTVNCGAGTRYQFQIDQDTLVPDPASRAQADDVHGPSLVVDARAYQWQTPNWHGRPWHETVIYELHVGLFGGFSEVEAYLPTLVELGVTAVELMPLAEFPGTRNWGYDGVLPFAVSSSYGTPDQLRSLIDKAHALGLMVFVDVVYNHFGPDGNYLGHYAREFFRDDLQTPWGAAIDFRQPQVRDFFCENALMWVLDYRVDGLRFDAVHAISERDFLVELAERVRAAVDGLRQVHLILENEDNATTLLQQGFDAQWNDDGHNVLHVLLTGEQEAYYADFAEQPTEKLARCLSEGFIYQGQASRHGKPRGEPSATLAPSAFVLFLQNHDQIGNRAFGERLSQLANPDALKAATALLLLSPMVPLMFMGDEWGSRQPFLFFTDHHDELADAVREGRRNEFADFSIFADAEQREKIPDPNALSTFTDSIATYTPESAPEQRNWRTLYRELLALRREYIMPRLLGTRALDAVVLGQGAVTARWEMGDGSVLRIDLNLSESPVKLQTVCAAEPIHAHRVNDDYRQGTLAAHSVAVSLEASHE